MTVRENISNGIIFEVVNMKNRLYLLEFNKGPEMKPKCKKDYKLKYKMNVNMYSKVGILNNRINNFNRIY